MLIQGIYWPAIYGLPGLTRITKWAKSRSAACTRLVCVAFWRTANLALPSQTTWVDWFLS